MTMFKEDLYATRKHASGINDMRAEISKLKAETGHRRAEEFQYDKGRVLKLKT
jgi:hypothetical protein